MAKNTIDRGSTSVIRHIFIPDSTSTTGAGKTGLAYNTANLTCYYLYAGGTATAITLEDITTLGTYSAPTSNAHMRFKEVSSTNMPGWYEIQYHNDWCSVASARVNGAYQLKGATGMAPVNVEFDLIGFNVQSAVPKVDLETIKTNPVVNAGTVTFPTTATLASTTNITAGIITTTTNLTNLPSIPAGWLTTAGIEANALNGKGDWNVGKTGYALTAAYDSAKTAAQAGNQMDLVSAPNAVAIAAIKTALEAAGSDLDLLVRAIVNKLLITEADGTAELFNDAGVSAGTITTCFSSIAGVTQRKALRL